LPPWTPAPPYSRPPRPRHGQRHRNRPIHD
jgi:hypothetical protein